MKKNKLIAGTVCTVALIAAAGIFLWNYNNQEETPVAIKSPIETAGSQEQTKPGNPNNTKAMKRKNSIIKKNREVINKMGTSTTDKVILGKEGWLFYNGPANTDADNIADYQGSNLFTEDELEKIKKNFETTRKNLEAKGIQFVLMLIPNKENVYAEYMPDAYGKVAETTRIEQVTEYLREHTDVNVVYPMEEMQQTKADYPQYDLYTYLGTHWNSLGAYVGAKTLLEQVDVTLPEISSLKLKYTKEGDADLSDMLGTTEQMQDNNYEISGYSDHEVTNITWDETTEFRCSTTEADERKYLMVRDSFTTAMVPYIASNFNDSYFIHMTQYDGSIIEKEQPDIVVYEFIERFAGALLEDKYVVN